MFNKLAGRPDAKAYIDKYFAKKLQSEGFVCPDNKSLCWYRIQNNSIINSVIFFFMFSSAPWVMLMGYNFHPLFQMPPNTKNALYPDRPLVEETLEEVPLFDVQSAGIGGSLPIFTNLPVISPPDGGDGIYMLEHMILPRMERATSIETCYQLHKNRRLEQPDEHSADKFRTIGSIFIDEAIYMNDTEVFPYCADRIDNIIEWLEETCTKKPFSKATRLLLEEWRWRKAALTENRREEYLQRLNERLQSNLHDMRQFLKQSTD